MLVIFMRYIDLLGLSDKEREKELFSSHENLLKHLKIVKETIKDMNSSKMVPNLYFDKLQYLLMDSAGYMSKKVDYNKKETIVTFTNALFSTNELMGKGENELEAVCDACSNFVNDPYKYNTFSIKYVNQLKKDFPGIVK